MDKKIIGLVGIIIALVLVIIAFFTPWYSTSMKIESNFPEESGDVNHNIYLTKTETKGSMFGDKVDETQSFSDYGNFPGKSVFDNTFYLTIIAIIFSVIAFVGFLGFSFNFSNPETMKKIGVIFGILVIVIAFITPIYFMGGPEESAKASYEAYTSMTGGPVDFEYSFWFSLSEGGAEVNGGPGIAWYLMIVAGIIALISSVIILKKDKETILPQPQQ